MKKNIIIVSLLIIISILSYKLYVLNDEYLTLHSVQQTAQNRLIVSEKKLSSYKEQIEFMDRSVAICPADGTGLYHKYGCEDLDLSSYYIYNISQAPNKGFSPCSLCSDLDNTKDKTGIIVYVTNTGSKYHRSGCSYLKSKNPITLEKALSKGYGACSRCSPPKGK